ncbi:cytochrome P450 4c3-like isoform X2 [Plodia interpunctella]|uniref:cytochrome P450 4c3-like isoform X2 n=1 Tax=Plodia interpunctella TaxID=58824 RepID=UPI0023688185|nr:cytochrome P450 4c3-like isoform X2 [Plodia interpunctella]
MIVLLLVSLIAIIIYWKYRRDRKHLYELSNILAGPGCVPVLGHSHWFIGSPEMVTNPEDVQIVLDNCLEKDHAYKFLQAWLGNGLFVAPVDLWKSHRRVILPIFQNRLIEDFIEVFGEQGSILVKRLENEVGKPEFDVFKYITSCMLDIVFETAMGERMDVQHNPDTRYMCARNAVMSIINMRLFKPWMQPDALFNLTKQSKIQKDNIDITHKFTDEVVMRKRKDHENGKINEGRKDLLELLLTRDMKLTNEELREHIDSITIAGNDTTALVVSYALQLLGHHQAEQELVHKELQNIFGDSSRQPNKEDLMKMEYLERVIKETMRLFTVVPLIARRTQKEVKLSSLSVPAGVGCAVVPRALHRSARLWGADAGRFNPDRFRPEHSARRHPCAFIPFSYGARNCIGRHFGMLVMKSILANVLRSYKVKSSACGKLKIEILLFPVSGHLITLEKREMRT